MPGNWEQKAQLMRVAVLPIPGMKIFYTNALQTKIVRGGLFAHSLAFPGRKGTRKALLCLQPKPAFAMNAGERPTSCKRPSPGSSAEHDARIAAQ